jgi:tetratricopeptide (TPR) repeat protein
LIARARPEVEKAATPKDKIAALNKVLLDDRNVSYLSNLYWRDATLAASLLRKQGNCLSTATLYLLAGEALKLPIHMVMVPQHALARWDEGATRINIETTAKGCEIDDSYYFRQECHTSPEEIDAFHLGKSLSGDEAYAELLAVAAGHRSGENKLEEAVELLERALKLQPSRRDFEFQRISIMSNLPGGRAMARRNMAYLAQGKHGEPASLIASALQFLAHDAAGTGDHKKEREFLMASFVKATRLQQPYVLTELAFCLRALRDYHGAVRYMELAAIMEEGQVQYPDYLYSLAIMQKNAGDITSSLATIEKARAANPESWYLQILQAGYLIFDGQTERGQKLYDTLEKPHGDVEFWEIMQSWFWTQTQNREKFYPQFERALDTARSPRILEWVDQDPDLDFVRGETKFKELIDKHRARLNSTK